MSVRVLLVEDDRDLSRLIARHLTLEGYDAIAAFSVAEAAGALCGHGFDAAVLDLKLPDGDGLDVLRMLQDRQPGCIVVLLTGHGSIPSAVEATRLGAIDYLTKPVPVETILARLKRALDSGRIGLPEPGVSAGLVGQSPKFTRVLKDVRTVAPTDAAVLIEGESGTGKELFADLTHRLSKRSTGPMVKVNCGAIPETLMESELFGHEQGAFTGATRRRVGRLEAASGGTLFLDEVGEIPPQMQVKLLRALQEKKIQRLGSEEEIAVDFRLVAATHRDVRELVRAGVLREDFFFRLSVFPIQVPGLRERREDIALLLAHFLNEFSKANGATPARLAPDALEVLLHYPWPGNVRELRNLAERLQILFPGRGIAVRNLPREYRRSGTGVEVVNTDVTLREAVHRFERRFIDLVVAEENGNKTAASRRLGISRKNLWEKLSAVSNAA